MGAFFSTRFRALVSHNKVRDKRRNGGYFKIQTLIHLVLMLPPYKISFHHVSMNFLKVPSTNKIEIFSC